MDCFDYRLKPDEALVIEFGVEYAQGIVAKKGNMSP